MNRNVFINKGGKKVKKKEIFIPIEVFLVTFFEYHRYENNLIVQSLRGLRLRGDEGTPAVA